MNKKQKNLTNKGFSLVELIIVIAIMAVLVGVLAPQFIKYVEQSRKSTDIQNAENIKTAVLADIADGNITGSGTLAFSGTLTKDASGTVTSLGASTITSSETPKVQGNLVNHGGNFTVTWDAVAGTCHVYPESGNTRYDLTDSTAAGNYKADTTPRT